MIATISPQKLHGSVRVPASKSMAHRMLIAAALSDRPTLLEISALNSDIRATMQALQTLGAKIELKDGLYRISPIQNSPEKCVIDCVESGSTLRFLLPLAGALPTTATFVGQGRLPQRPNLPLTQAMIRHGGKVTSDLLPATVSGSIHPGIWEIPGNVSSQYITGLMFALPLLNGDSDIVLTTPLESAAYIDMTQSALEAFGIVISATEGGFHIPGHQRYISPGKVHIEGDWSAAAFWLAANHMGSAIDIHGLNPQSRQGDRAAVDCLGQSHIACEDIPDLVPALSVCAALQPQTTVITGAARLRLKESDRLATVAAMLENLGVDVKIHDDGLTIFGRSTFKGCTVNGANDHRIVMAAAIAATCADGPVTITDCEAVNKSYPDFFRDYEKLGGKVHVQ